MRVKTRVDRINEVKNEVFITVYYDSYYKSNTIRTIMQQFLSIFFYQ